jgi:hypothetical protein
MLSRRMLGLDGKPECGLRVGKQKDRPKAVFHGNDLIKSRQAHKTARPPISYKAESEEAQDHHCPGAGLGNGADRCFPIIPPIGHRGKPLGMRCQLGGSTKSG